MTITKKIENLEDYAEKNNIDIFKINSKIKSFIIEIHSKCDIFISKHLSNLELLKVLAHEIGHYKNGIYYNSQKNSNYNRLEHDAEKWATLYIVDIKDYIKGLNDDFVTCHYTMAEYLNVDVQTVLKAREYFLRKGWIER